MPRKGEVLAEAPRIAASNVDFSAMHDAIAAGKTEAEVIAAATGQPAPAPETPAPEADASDDAA